MPGPKIMELNVRPRVDEEDGFTDEYDSFEDGVDYYPEYESEEEAIAVNQPAQNNVQNAPESNEEEEQEGISNDEDGEEVQQQISRTSFGALKQAQDTLSNKRKRGSDSNEAQEEKLAALRSRLEDLRSKKNQSSGGDRLQASNGHVQQDASQDEDSDSAPSEEEAPSKSRTSKHKPGSQSSRRQVTRKRNVIEVPKRTYRDPRFDALNHQPPNFNSNSEKAYAFLTDYQKSEIKELRTAIKATANEDEKETLRRKMVSMENRLKSKAAKEREQEVVRKHRREEREKVEQGKQPYHLKEREVKQKALEAKFQGMKGKERERLMERRRNKEGQREKKKMPMARRVER